MSQKDAIKRLHDLFEGKGGFCGPSDLGNALGTIGRVMKQHVDAVEGLDKDEINDCADQAWEEERQKRIREVEGIKRKAASREWKDGK